MNDIQVAKESLDKIIKKARVHLYKPIQIAEILYQDRVNKNINLLDKETYRNISKNGGMLFVSVFRKSINIVS